LAEELVPLLERIAAALEVGDRLGFCASPEVRYLYISNEGDCPWYFFDIDTQQKTLCKYEAIKGRLVGIRCKRSEYKGKENLKLDLFVQAERNYAIRTGLETVFARSLLLGLAAIPGFEQPVTIAPTLGKESVVFCRLYDVNGQKVQVAWDAEADCYQLARNLAALHFPGMSFDSEPTTSSSSSSPSREVLINQVALEMGRLNWSVERGKNYLQFSYKKSSRQQLTDQELHEFVNYLRSQKP
jgi:hypothetical protein